MADHGLTNRAANGAGVVQPPSLPLPSRSALEGITANEPGLLANLMPVWAAITSTQRHLRRRPLLQVLSRLVAYRALKTEPPATSTAEHFDLRLLDSAAAFRRARPYVPTETVCLLDSIALVRFLARRGLYAQLVFGVTDDPFSAHCWVQAGDLVLNDTVGDVSAHTPIRVI
nr:lasso peptide biosynthesis B2 protein [Stenotrophomonas maltophilia]